MSEKIQIICSVKDCGWPTPVVFNKDRKKYPQADEIEPGWFGAMCQGQAISVLVRAFIATQDDKYLIAAEDAVSLFNISSRKGGLKAVFMDRYVWYEEYPTNPPSFILNGFMFSLLGLYDLQYVSVKLQAHVSQLFKEGLESLAAMLPLYDSGPELQRRFFRDFDGVLCSMFLKINRTLH